MKSREQWERSARSYSPLHKLRKQGKLHINGNPYISPSYEGSDVVIDENGDFIEKPNMSRTNLYNNYKRNAFQLSKEEKQLQDFLVNKAANNPNFKHFNISEIVENKPGVIQAGGYDYKDKKLDLYDYGNKLPTSGIYNPARTANHELTHMWSDLETKAYKPLEEYIEQFSGSEKDKLLKDMKGIVDPTGAFQSSYKVQNYAPSYDEIQLGKWPADEYTAHFTQNIRHPQDKIDNKAANKGIALLLKEVNNNFSPHSKEKYPELMNLWQKKINALEYSPQLNQEEELKRYEDLLAKQKHELKDLYQLQQQPSYQSQQQQLGYIAPKIQRPSAFLDKIRAQINPDKQKGYFNQPKQNPGFEPRQQHFQPSNQFSQFGQQAAQQQNLLNAQQQEEYNQYRNQERSAFDDSPILSPRTWLQQQNQQQELQQKQEEDIHGNPFPNQRQQRFASGGPVGSDSYDPYLNTYNYASPLSPAEYMDNQMPDSRYEDAGYDYPNMSYSNAYDNDGQQYSFKEGGSVKEEDLPRLADLIRRHGRNGDTELAHINPIEAHILKSLGGSGTINPATGLREYSFWKKPWKAIRSVIGGGAGAVIGNMIAPGIGGIIGGALGQGVQHAARGKSALSGALKGAGMGAALPSVASVLGSGASKLGATALGSSLSNYGSTNAILPALGMGSSSGSSGLLPLGGSNPYVSSGLSAATALSSGMGGAPAGYGQYPQMQYSGYPYVDNRGFLEKFGDNAKDYLTQPGNLLTLGTVAAQYAGRQKPKSPEKIAEEERRYRNASRKTIAEVEADEALETARADLQKKRKNKQLEEDIKNMGSVRRRAVSPEEFARTGRWLEYEDEEGRPLRMKGGGSVPSPYAYLTEETYYPASPIGYLSGDSGGQDDLIDAKLSDGEYVFDASTVSDLGDGNNAAGARKLDMFRENIRKHKRGGKVMLPPRAKSLESYLRG